MRLIDGDKLLESLLQDKITSGMQKARFLDLVRAAPTVGESIDAPGKWISVNDALPTEVGQDCWIWCDKMNYPDADWWEGERGETTAAFFPDGEHEYVKSGWYYNDMLPITHWMPIPRPEPPEPPTGDKS
jgi:hypothetical protein